MNIHSLKIVPTNPDHASPLYEVHDWDKVNEIVKATRDNYDGEFTFVVFGNVSAKAGV